MLTIESGHESLNALVERYLTIILYSFSNNPAGTYSIQ